MFTTEGLDLLQQLRDTRLVANVADMRLHPEKPDEQTSPGQSPRSAQLDTPPQEAILYLLSLSLSKCPTLTGQAAAQARDMLEAAMLSLQTDSENYDTQTDADTRMTQNTQFTQHQQEQEQRPLQAPMKHQTTAMYLNSDPSSRPIAVVPPINEVMKLDGKGDFVAGAPSLSSSILSMASSNMEDSIMDVNAQRKLSFKEIGSAEKRAVFQLTAVRRSMRHLEHNAILMTDEVLQLSARFMEIGPHRSSLMSIGHSALQEGCDERTVRDEWWKISPLHCALKVLRGNQPVCWVLVVAAIAGEIALCCIVMSRKGTLDFIAVTQVRKRERGAQTHV